MKKNKKVLIVGTGIGGLTAGLRLVKKGYDVEFVEKYFQAGGRANQIKKDGFVFDTGPSFFSMSYVFKDFAKDCGINLPFSYEELDPLFSINFDNKKVFYIYKDIKKLSKQFENIEENFEQKFINYLKKSEDIFNETFNTVIQKNYNTLLDYILTLIKVNPRYLPYIFRSFYDEIKRNFSSEEARIIFSLISFFLGKNPFDTMAIYTLLSYVEFKNDGYYFVKGGMYKVIEGLVKELQKDNVIFNYNTEIVDFVKEGNKIKFLVDQKGKKWSADIFLINSDAAYFRGKVFKKKKYSDENLNKMDWTTGYLTIYLGVKGNFDNLCYHNYYLGYNFKDYSQKIIKDKNLPQIPYYYVNVLSKKNKECAPPGCEALFFVCPVPNLIYKSDWSDKDLIVSNILDDFSKKIGRDIKKDIVLKIVWTPEDWQNNFNLYKGSGLGLSHDFNQIVYFRPKNFDEDFKNVFYVGSSTLPGAGIPMVVISSKLAVERIEKYVSSLS